VAIERVDYYDEGHGFSLASNHADWLQRLEAFFAKAFAKP
jgi:dipeptidyl aminopeptidase/acylaminoacyl peptidase